MVSVRPSIVPPGPCPATRGPAGHFTACRDIAGHSLTSRLCRVPAKRPLASGQPCAEHATWRRASSQGGFRRSGPARQDQQSSSALRCVIGQPRGYARSAALCTETPSSIWLVGGAPNRIFCCSLFLANSRRSLPPGTVSPDHEHCETDLRQIFSAIGRRLDATAGPGMVDPAAVIPGVCPRRGHADRDRSGWASSRKHWP